LKNPYVKRVKGEKGKMIGSVRFSFFAVVEYDIEVIYLNKKKKINI
jgi:hypothetical protein